MNTQILEKIGLTKGESKVYLTLLKIGQTTISKLVTESEVSRSKVYEILDRLMQKGLVSSIIEEESKHFMAINPKIIPDLLDKRVEEITEQKKEIMNSLPELLRTIETNKNNQSVQVVQGWKAVKNIFYSLIKEASKKDIWYAFGIPKAMAKERETLFKHWRHETDKIGIKQMLIANKEIRNSEELAPKSKFSSIRYNSYETPTSVDIFKNNVILGVWAEKPIIILIEGKSVAQSFKAFFDILWKSAKI